MFDPKVLEIYVAPLKGAPMQAVPAIIAVEGRGLAADRYVDGSGSWNQDKPGKRQVTLIDASAFPGTGFTHAECRRNIVVSDIHLMELIDPRFSARLFVGGAILHILKPCDPCDRPGDLCRKPGFKEAFEKNPGVIAEVLRGGEIKAGDRIMLSMSGK